MREHGSPRVFEIVFPASPRLRDIVRASPSQPLPPVPTTAALKLPPPSVPDAAAMQREERQAIEQTLAQLRQTAEQLKSRYDSMAAEMRQAAVELAIAVAGRVVFDKLQAGDFPIEEMVRQAAAHLPSAPTVTVYLHPQDLVLLRRRLALEGDKSQQDKETRRQGDKEKERQADGDPESGSSVSLSPCLLVSLSSSGKPELHIEADPSLPRGGCRAEAGEIHVLADLATQLAELRQQLLWSASHARSGSRPSAS